MTPNNQRRPRSNCRRLSIAGWSGICAKRTDVQNIDLMNLAGFCRNCLANWYQEAENAMGGTLTKEAARAMVYGMPYKDWQAKHQTAASASQTAAFDKSKPHDH